MHRTATTATSRSFLLNCLLFCVFLLHDVQIAHSWVAIGRYHNDDYPGKCFITETIVLSPGELAKMPDECAQITCSNGDTGLADITGCGAVAPPPSCEWDDYVDVNAPYPQCCVRKVICANAENLTAALEYQQHVRELFGVRNDDGVEQRIVDAAGDVPFLETNKI